MVAITPARHPFARRDKTKVLMKQRQLESIINVVASQECQVCELLHAVVTTAGTVVMMGHMMRVNGPSFMLERALQLLAPVAAAVSNSQAGTTINILQVVAALRSWCF